MRLPIAIIGNGGAAAEAVLALRANGCTEQIHLFADNRHGPYNPMLGPYLVAGKITLERAFRFGAGLAFYDANRVTTHLDEPVTRVDAEARQLTTASGRTYLYDRCLVATGARPAVPPITGLREALGPNTRLGSVRRRRVFTLQTLEDALALKDAAEGSIHAARERLRGGAAEPPRAAVVGASFAGVKIAAVLHDMGFDVTLIEREPSILPLAAHPEAARVLEAHLRQDAYGLRTGAALTAVHMEPADGEPTVHRGDGVRATRLEFGPSPGATEPGRGGGAACDDSSPSEEVDLLVVCAGNRPALDFLAPAEVDMGTGILVDERMCSNVETLYAAGDVAQGKNLVTGRREIIGLWSSARFQGRAAGRSLAGVASGYPGGVPHNITHVGRMLFASVGCVDDYDEVTVTQVDGSPEIRMYREGRLVGLNLLGRCLSAGVARYAFTRAEATWTSFSG